MEISNSGKKLIMASRNLVSQSDHELHNLLMFLHTHIVANLENTIVPSIIDMLRSTTAKYQIDATDACSQLVPLSEVMYLGSLLKLTQFCR